MVRKAGLAGKGVAILLGGAVLGVLLLTLAFMIPVNSENRQISYDIIEQEGWYPAMPVLSRALDTYFHSLLPGVLDDSTDLIMLRTAMETNESNPLRAGMDALGYSYYWHGYVAILRPLLSILDYGEIRVFNSILQMLLIFGLMYLLGKKMGLRYALILFTSYVLLMPMAMFMSLQFSWVFYISYGGTAFVLLKQQWLGQKARIFFMFLILGMLTSFLDLLTYPLYTWAIPLIWFLVVSEEGANALCHVKKVVGTGLCWLAGYAGMWVSKWILGGWILNRNIFEEAIEEVLFRSGVGEAAQDGLAQRLEAMYMNWKHYEYKLYAIILALWLLWIIYKSIRTGWQNSQKNAAYLLIAFSAVVWYFVLSNHTLGHHFFTYRIWGITVAALLVLFMGSLGEAKSRRSGKEYILTAAVWGILGICSFGLSFLAREDVMVVNGTGSFQKVDFPEGSTLTVSFTPTFPVITEWGFGISSTSTRGECLISLYDGEQVLYTEKIPLKELEDAAYKAIPVDWKLEAGKEYQIRAVLQDSNGESAVSVTQQMAMYLNEYGELSIDGVGAGGQPLAGMKYRYRPLSRATLLFLTMSWMGVLASILLEVKQVVIGRFNGFVRRSQKV